MKRRPVLHYPDERLRIATRPVDDREFGTTELSELVAEMTATMRALKGIGIAATQIGVNKALAVIELDDGPMAIANPTVRNAAKRLEVQEEGCLSVPGVFGLVNRAATLTLIARTIDGKPFRIKADGLFARVIQHETDHLNGRLFIDRCHEVTDGVAEAKRLGLSIPPLQPI
ncbi:MAG: peptide deformylase [Candidatus Kerfeldbacteria bacterium]|nr:peptide deformylase [Candidatus Kerfeldbacteria bacterium]